MPAVTSIIAAVSLTASVVEAGRARGERKKARVINERRGRLQTARQATEQVRVAQVARAQVVQQAEAGGIGGSSPVQGALGSIQSQAGSNIGFAQTLFNLQQQIRNRLERAADFTANSQAFGQIATFSANTDFSKIFRTSGSPAPVTTSQPI